MKKSLIAGAGATAFAFAALPFAGVFAAGGTVTDNLTVNIPASCTITNSNSTTPSQGRPGQESSDPALTNDYYVTMHNNELRSDIGGSADSDPHATATATNTINVSCNTAYDAAGGAGAWRLTAEGAGSGTDKTALTGSAGDIVTGTATSGATSNWAFKVEKSSSAPTTGDGSVNYAGTYDGSFVEVPAPSSPMNIATGAGTVQGAFTMTYQVFISQTQATGEYTGAVKYTLVNPAP